MYYSVGTPAGLNQKFADRFDSFNPAELTRLTKILEELGRGRDYEKLTVLSEEDAALMRRAIDVAGDLEVGWFDTHWQLDTFRGKPS